MPLQSAKSSCRKINKNSTQKKKMSNIALRSIPTDLPHRPNQPISKSQVVHLHQATPAGSASAAKSVLSQCTPSPNGTLPQFGLKEQVVEKKMCLHRLWGLVDRGPIAPPVRVEKNHTFPLHLGQTCGGGISSQLSRTEKNPSN